MQQWIPKVLFLNYGENEFPRFSFPITVEKSANAGKSCSFFCASSWKHFGSFFPRVPSALDRRQKSQNPQLLAVNWGMGAVLPRGLAPETELWIVPWWCTCRRAGSSRIVSWKILIPGTAIVASFEFFQSVSAPALEVGVQWRSDANSSLSGSADHPWRTPPTQRERLLYGMLAKTRRNRTATNSVIPGTRWSRMQRAE